MGTTTTTNTIASNMIKTKKGDIFKKKLKKKELNTRHIYIKKMERVWAEGDFEFIFGYMLIPLPLSV